MTVSRSGQTCRPNGVKSSPVLPMTVISASGTASSRPRRNRAAPTPPARTVMRMDESLATEGIGARATPVIGSVAGASGRAETGPAGPVPGKNLPDFRLILGQPGDHYHLSPLTRRKTRGCNFTHVILAPKQTGAGPRGTDGREVC